MNGADLLCETLLAGGVDVCFANPGTSEMHFVAALDRRPQMKCVLGLFEGVVTGAADGYARMAGKPAATLLHLGPGAANGLANLHNARRARSGIVNVVGDHATRHLAHDAPLTSDIESLVRPMSHWVKRIPTAADVAADTAQAIAAARARQGQVATLILPADCAWTEAGIAAPAAAAVEAPPAPAREAVVAAAAALRAGKRTLLLLGHTALRAAPLATAARIAAHCGARLLAEGSNARVERGGARVAVERVKYQVDAAVAQLRDVDQVILIGAREPVAFFAYPGKPGTLLPEGCRILPLAAAEDAAALALAWLADELGVPGTQAPPAASRAALPALPGGPLTSQAVCAVVARLMPDNAIICDEAITAGAMLYEATAAAPAHDYLQLTGGAIGQGLPLATGAALACPDRRVICVEGDGSGMYTVQALWTQAREQLDVITIVLANRSYAILHDELRNVGAGAAGRNSRSMLDLDGPALGWAQIAGGMGVPAVSVQTVDELVATLGAALARPGPSFIEAIV